MQKLKGKKAFVTAAGQGIGRAVAEKFAEHGAHVIATDINPALLADYKNPDIHTAVLDVTDRAAVNTAIKDAGAIDILFNCAGFVANGTVLECDDESWDFSFKLNVNSMYYTTSAALPAMLKNGGGSIVNMSSVASSLKGVPNRFAYTTTKAAVIGLTKSIAADYVTQSIRCNAICPGTIDSPSLHERLEATGDYEKAMADFINRQPMGRIGTAEEIANLALYLGSEDSAFTTGQTHVIDGGWAL